MIGLIGILGCLVAIVIVAGSITAIATGISAGYGIAGYYQEKEAAQDMMDLELTAQKKAEKRTDFQSAIQKRMQEKNASRLRGQMGSAIALDHLRAKRTKYSTAKKRAEINRIGGAKIGPQTARPKTQKARKMGNPTSNEV